jgi:hypothetical protein
VDGARRESRASIEEEDKKVEVESDGVDGREGRNI